MNVFHALAIGVLEGLTEFLPVSSTAHMLLAERLLGLAGTEFLKSFTIIVQFGAILAVAGMYLRRFLTDWRTNLRIAAAFIPTGVIGFALYGLVKAFLFEEVWLTLAALFLGGIVLILFERREPGRGRRTELEDISYPQALWIGLAQALAVVPGVSRSAATIVGGELARVSRRAVVEFSFLLAVPTMLAAAGYDLLKNAPHFAASEFHLLAVGFIAAFISAWVSVRWFLNYLKRHSLAAFGWYRIVLALVLATTFFLR